MILVPERRNDQNTRAQKISREPSRKKIAALQKKILTEMAKGRRPAN
jgi:hypothetical protein